MIYWSYILWLKWDELCVIFRVRGLYKSLTVSIRVKGFSHNDITILNIIILASTAMDDNNNVRFILSSHVVVLQLRRWMLMTCHSQRN